ncbi:Gfo/Idh/MocA family protein [Edaphobacter albus]|uniref:Gfo/Idh/MocA family protein n=1 Tax=Edaphobacter sp. 4G125 TaxID=2763071 RepID=UPI00164545C4|nr:Gfo/Idh/MocA family oxidoreductase [Edaphobacter sp. 4G125]QNI35781.1 Gfo/Idh/MocA family oxidoreductase [Edaphobacter sp. 4G125]
MDFNFSSWSRRRFVQLGAASALTKSFASASALQKAAAPVGHATMIGVPFAKRNPRIALVGVGVRGTGHLKMLIALDAQIVAICDVVKEKAENGAALVEKSGKKRPDLYTAGPHDFENMLKRNDIDLVLTATPWSWHAPVALFAMNHGKDVGIEVPGVVTLEECWDIVNTSERTRKHCFIMENCCYGYNETLVLRMTNEGRFGELIYGEGAYIHDIREELFQNKANGLWRRAEHTKRNGNLYPTHGLGPVANYMNINRGDRFGYLVSMSSIERGLDIYRKEHLQPGDPRWSEKYICGDMNTSLIKTSKGLTITVKHAVSLPNPYSRINMIAGTKGIFEDYPPRIYLEGDKEEVFGSLDKYKSYTHPLWAKEGDFAAKTGGHGGMDMIMHYRMLQCLREGLPPDIDVYDTAAWSSVGPLSVTSVAKGSTPIEFPDFTRGAWKIRSASAIATMS